MLERKKNEAATAGGADERFRFWGLEVVGDGAAKAHDSEYIVYKVPFTPSSPKARMPCMNWPNNKQ